jgi:mannose-6-phosphate isomerase-like protein (cupin superfamily)
MDNSTAPTRTAAVRIDAHGQPPKTIEEHVGRLATGNEDVSVAVMRSPAGWTEPGQTPDFDEHTTVLTGRLLVHHRGGTVDVPAGQTATVPRGCWVRYETLEPTEYISVCLPAFSPSLVHRDDSDGR